MRTKTNTETNNSLEKCEKNVSEPFKQYLSISKFIYAPVNVFSTPMGAINIRIL